MALYMTLSLWYHFDPHWQNADIKDKKNTYPTNKFSGFYTPKDLTSSIIIHLSTTLMKVGFLDSWTD